MSQIRDMLIESILNEARVVVRQEAHVASHDKEAKGKGTWAFGKTRNPDIKDVYFCKNMVTVAQGAKEAAEHFGVSEVWVQP